MLNRTIIVRIMKTIMRIIMIGLFINKDYIKGIKNRIKIRDHIRIKGLRECRLSRFLKKHILTISLTKIMVLKIIIKISIIKILIYIIKMKNNFTMRIKRLLLKKRKILKMTKLILNSYL